MSLMDIDDEIKNWKIERKMGRLPHKPARCACGKTILDLKKFNSALDARYQDEDTPDRFCATCQAARKPRS